MTYPTLTIFGEPREPHVVGTVNATGEIERPWVRWVARVWPFIGVVRLQKRDGEDVFHWDLVHDDQTDGNEFGRQPFRRASAPTLERAVFDLEVEARTLWGNAQRVFGGR